MHVCGSSFGVEPCAKHPNKHSSTLINEVIPIMVFVPGVWPSLPSHLSLPSITPSKSAHPLELKPNHHRPGLIKRSAWDGKKKKRGIAPKCYKLPTGLRSLGRRSAPGKGTRELGGHHSKSWLEGFGGERWREGGGVKQSLLQVHTSFHCCSAPNANHKGGVTFPGKGVT